jgi:subfamily B ATP-binding cassette protein HlyB/CyaB
MRDMIDTDEDRIPPGVPAIGPSEFVWALGCLCTIHRVPFSPPLLLQQFPPPYKPDDLVHAARRLGLKAELRLGTVDLSALRGPVLVLLSLDGKLVPAMVVARKGADVVVFAAGSDTPVTRDLTAFVEQLLPWSMWCSAVPEPVTDPDMPGKSAAAFGFRWFGTELLKHRKVWREVLLASLGIQLLALGLPLFTQVIIDKVVVHRTESTLWVIAAGMGLFMAFSAILGWTRQTLILHTGNRVDAVLGSAVCQHLFKLPPRYFEQRATGVIAARLHGVESIREFLAGAAVALVLDIPFLAIFVAIMLCYSVKLSVLVGVVLALLAACSAAVAPLFRRQLNEQFALGARNQAFVTEYVAGIDTVKSLQMEPQLRERYDGFLATYLEASFRTRQTANTYSTVANVLEQAMTLGVLVLGAYTVIHDPAFSIGMLVAFQMFAGRVSQPVLRLVGLWQQFQQARMSVQRLGDILNAPIEPYSVTPSRQGGGPGRIDIEAISFRYHEQQPLLYENFSLRVEPGMTVAITGPSGSGKSTLTKLLQGFYRPAGGRILLDGVDISTLSANELRSHFGVVPQETVLFSGTILDNLMAANPHATFDDVVEACRMAEMHEAIERQPQGYQTVLGERGVGLSGGQRQRLAIARALLKRPRILIFDEATSSLDEETADQVAKTINALGRERIVLFITHKLPRSLVVHKTVAIGRSAPLARRPVPCAPSVPSPPVF